MNPLEKSDGVDADFPEGSMELLKSVLEAHEYQFKECIGSGGFSMVFRVHSLRYKSDFAAKVTNVKSARHRTASASYSNEHAALSRLNHPNIIRLYDSFDSGDYAFLILEYCQNGSIRDKISVSGLPEGPCRLMLRQLVDAVSHMHSCGIVHRDIKPSNVLLDSYGRPKLADFGLALCLKQGQFLHDHSGSLQYMAPEIMRKPCFDPFKADVWALGVTFHEMVLGALKWPRKKQQVESVVLSAGLMLTTVVPMQLAKVIRSMTAVDAEDRPTMDRIAATHVFDDPGGGSTTARGASGKLVPQPRSLQLTPGLRHNSALCIQSQQRRSVGPLFPVRPEAVDGALATTRPGSILMSDTRKLRTGAPLVPKVKKTPIP